MLAFVVFLSAISMPVKCSISVLDHPGILYQVGQDYGPSLFGEQVWQMMSLAQTLLASDNSENAVTGRATSGTSGSSAAGLLKWFIGDEDLRWFVVTVWSVYTGDYGCMYRLSCENPSSGLQYSSSPGRVLYSLQRLVGKESQFKEVMTEIKYASDRNSTTLPCHSMYSCKAPFTSQ